jgi:hypothetical protein
VYDEDGVVRHRSDLDELFGISTTSMDFDPLSKGKPSFKPTCKSNRCSTTQTLRLMWWKQHHQEFPDLTRMVRQYLTAPATSASPERFFSRVGLVQTDLRGRLLDTVMIDLMWVKQAPQVKSSSDTPIHTHFPLCLTHQYE